MTLKFKKILEVDKVRVCAKIHQAKCSGLLVIVLRKKRKSREEISDGTETVLSSLPRTLSRCKSTHLQCC